MNKSTVIGRRQVLKGAGLGALAVVGTGLTTSEAAATPEKAAKAISKFTGGKKATAGKVTVKLPEIAENGRTVPVTVSVDSPMTDADHVKSVILVAEGNPSPEVVSFTMAPGLGKAEVSTRMRLGKTQNVVAAAVMSDGSVYSGTKQVKVTIGGCGG
ncbi:MAG: thiosulfate oxidation carrier protein SoxY [Rhodospirillaceae bacterium]|jgi:sulfur-oxidizing protein SoxY|nr:thiosulfate oxidation carrier protein SoxY [Rhodospirillaceae bacterium]MBT4464822.1 thiosulfate oxidation carrier protein SoxY [Rhodospirillaceae bacterium]MBT5308082.1 thiosulfate oxidation carrier protein SoxY [Rhodospirillaceae bacterium]MBT7357201.1 thiosulfate oxidation carrier protein SoxY [Rhodospirillaceae bacterium]